ncbi:MAG: NADP-dependent oxidoreductase, partial [Pseudomonadota bacterium]
PLNAPMVGTTISKVIESRNDDYAVGDHVQTHSGWQEFSVSDGKDLTKIAESIEPKTLALGALGLPGHTAYGALLRVGRPQKGETLLVSAASGAVGSVATQIGRIMGLNVVGIVGGEDKCRYIIDELGASAAIDRNAPNFAENLKAACPNGVDIYFDNVAGDMALDVIDQMSDYGRYLVCGTISIDRDAGFGPGTDNFQKVLATLLVKRLTLQGFIFGDFLDMLDDFHRDVGGWIKSGDLKYREHVVDGIENAPSAFLGLFSGQNFGKLVVRVSE